MLNNSRQALLSGLKNNKSSKKYRQDIELTRQSEIEIIPDLLPAFLIYEIERVEEDELGLFFPHSSLKKALQELSPREQKVLDLLFYKSKTLGEAGLICNLSAERVRQIEKNALKKLRHPRFFKYFREYQ